MSKNNNIKIWIRALRAPFFIAAIAPVILGAAIGWHDKGIFLWWRFFLTLIGAVLIHAGANLANDYFDHVYGCDEKNPQPTPFCGGSRVIQEGLIKPENILFASLLCFSFGAGIGLYLNYLAGTNVIFIFGVIGVAIGICYTIKPFRIVYGGLGELAVGISFGPLLVAGAYYVQAQALNFRIFLISIPMAILIALILFINEFQDCYADKSADKRTLVVIFGKKGAVIMYHILLILVYLIILLLIVFQILPISCLIVLLSLPLAIKAFTVSKRNYDKIYELLPANAATIGLQAIIGILLSAGIIIDKII